MVQPRQAVAAPAGSVRERRESAGARSRTAHSWKAGPEAELLTARAGVDVLARHEAEQGTHARATYRVDITEAVERLGLAGRDIEVRTALRIEDDVDDDRRKEERRAPMEDVPAPTEARLPVPIGTVRILEV